MISDFNEKYFTQEPPRLPDYSINGADFVESEMLDLSYVFPMGMFVNLEAPEGGTSYSWKCINSDGTEHEISTSRVLYYETPGYFKDGEENTLLLTVTVGDENIVEYKDHAIVILKKEKASENVCTLSIGINNSSSARTINPVSLSESAGELTHFVLKGISVTTGAELNDGQGIDLSSILNGNTTVASCDIPYGAWELTLEAGNGSEVLLKGRKYADLRTSKDTIRFNLTSTNIGNENGSVLLGGTYIDEGNVAKVCDAGLYSLKDETLKYSFEVTIDATVALTYSFVFDELTDVTPGRYSLIMKFYNSDDTQSRKQVGYWEDIVVVAPGRETKKTDIECKAIINQLPEKPASLKVYKKNDSVVVDENNKPQFFTVKFVWEDSSFNEDYFVLTVYENKKKNDTDVVELYKVYIIIDKIIFPNDKVYTVEDSFESGSLRAGSTECEIQLPCEGAFSAEIQAENYLGRSEVCGHEKGKDPPSGYDKFTGNGKTFGYKNN